MSNLNELAIRLETINIRLKRAMAQMFREVFGIKK